jgi:hypothetical protein
VRDPALPSLVRRALLEVLVDVRRPELLELGDVGPILCSFGSCAGDDAAKPPVDVVTGAFP